MKQHQLSWTFTVDQINPANISAEILTKDILLSTLKIEVWGLNQADNPNPIFHSKEPQSKGNTLTHKYEV